MDLFNSLLYFSGNVKTPTEIVFLLVLNRALMIGLGEHYWIYGYIILYLIYSIVFIVQIARNYFPLEGDIVLKSAKLENLLKSEEGLTKAAANKALKKGFNNPELLLILLSILYFILMCVASAMGGDDNITGTAIKTVDFTVNKTYKLEFWQAGLLSIFLVVSLYFVIALIRIYSRKATGAEQYSSEN